MSIVIRSIEYRVTDQTYGRYSWKIFHLIPVPQCQNEPMPGGISTHPYCHHVFATYQPQDRHEWHMCSGERSRHEPATSQSSNSSLRWGWWGKVLKQHSGSCYLGGLSKGSVELFLKPCFSWSSGEVTHGTGQERECKKRNVTAWLAVWTQRHDLKICRLRNCKWWWQNSGYLVRAQGE